MAKLHKNLTTPQIGFQTPKMGETSLPKTLTYATQALYGLLVFIFLPSLEFSLICVKIKSYKPVLVYSLYVPGLHYLAEIGL